MNGCCLELLAELYNDLEQAGMKLEVDLLPDAPKVLADWAAVRRIYENLFQNAKKHGQGSLWISSRLVSNGLLLSVSNPCSYISPEQFSRMCDRSYTMSKSRAEGNTGLGLAICKRLAEKMGREIDLTYQDGIFTVQITFHLLGGNKQ